MINVKSKNRKKKLGYRICGNYMFTRIIFTTD